MNGMLSVVIPTYNEKNNLEPLIREIDAALSDVCAYELIFVDDSTDDTPRLLEEISGARADVFYLHRDEKKGLASAAALGFHKAKGDMIAVMDADLQHPPQLLCAMYEAIAGGADIVLPSRYIEGGQDEGLSFFRKLASNCARYIGKLLLKSLRHISDPTSGYFMMKREVVVGTRLRPIGWKILMEVLVMGKYARVEELPYAFRKRHADQSKMSVKATVQYFLHILSLIARSERERRFYLFLLVGLSGVGVDMLIYFAISSALSLHVNLSATISALCAMISNYLLNRNLTWRSERSRNAASAALEFLKYALVSGMGIAIKNGFVFALFSAGMADWLCNLLGILGASLCNYFLTDRWVFRKRPASDR